MKMTTLTSAVLFFASLSLLGSQVHASSDCDDYVASIAPSNLDLSDSGAVTHYLWSYQEIAGEPSPLTDWVLLKQSHDSIARITHKTIHGVDPNLDEVGRYDHSAPLVTPPQAYELPANFKDLPKDEQARLSVKLANSKLTIEGTENPFRNSAFANALLQVVEEEKQKGIAPTEGLERTWSPEFSAHCSTDFLKFKFSRTLLVLARGDSARLNPTVYDQTLSNWVVAQEMNSLTPTELFRKAYQLTHGDVTTALLSIENVLSLNWRNPNRENLRLTANLVQIANFYQDRGTKFGVWYHLFGMIYYGYLSGARKALVIGAFEHAGSLIMGHFVAQEQKGAANLNGGFIGARLRAGIRSGSYEDLGDDAEALETSQYLRLNEDFRDRINVWSNPSFNLKLGDRFIELTSIKASYENCRVELIWDTGTGLAGGLKNIYQNINLTANQSTRILTTQTGVQGARAFLDGCTLKNSETARSTSN